MMKRAILFGMDKYRNVPKEKHLPATVNDVNLMENKLKKIYFTVNSYLDVTLNEMQNYLTEFALNAPCDSLNIVYFSGHGGHLENGNFILPIDFLDNTAKATSFGNLFDIRSIPTYFKRHVYLVIIIDACRTSLIKNCKNFVEMAVPADTYIAYATQFDTYSHCNNDISFYTKTLCEYMDMPNHNIEEIFNKTNNKLGRVYGQQVSNCISGLGEANLLFNEQYITDELTENICQFVDDNYESYIEKYGFCAGDDLVYIDASEKYGTTVLDAMYKDTRYRRLKAHQFTSLTENYSKLIFQNQMKRSGLHMDQEGKWVYRDRIINLGEVKDIPINAQPIYPIKGKEIIIQIKATLIDNEIHIASNIPDGIRLYGEIDNMYNFSNLTIKDGKEVVLLPKKCKNPKLINLKSTVYEITNADMDVIGVDGRNLIGPLVKFDGLKRNSIDCIISIEYR